jgi:hypothetical protein
MARRWTLLVATVVALNFATGCTSDPTAPAGPPAASSTPDNVIDFLGLPGLTIGSSLAELTAAGRVSTSNPGCGPAFTATENASPVFDADQLVLIWAYPPLHTPESIMVGTSVATARKAYPTAVELTRPAGSTQYPGLLVAGPDGLAYLFLHDGIQVQKLVVGQEKQARMLFDTGFGAC